MNKLYCYTHSNYISNITLIMFTWEERELALAALYIYIRVTCMVWCQVTAAAADAVTRLHGSADAPYILLLLLYIVIIIVYCYYYYILLLLLYIVIIIVYCYYNCILLLLLYTVILVVYCYYYNKTLLH